MKGTIMVELVEFLEQHIGLEQTDAVIQSVIDDLSTGGAYTAVGDYPHRELLALLSATVKLTGASLESVLAAFAEHVMDVFRKAHPEFFSDHREVFSLIAALERHIHVEVRKLYPDAQPPHISTGNPAGEKLGVSYQSHRPLGPFAVALIAAAGKMYDQPLVVEVMSANEDMTAMELLVHKR